MRNMFAVFLTSGQLFRMCCLWALIGQALINRFGSVHAQSWRLLDHHLLSLSLYHARSYSFPSSWDTNFLGVYYHTHVSVTKVLVMLCFIWIKIKIFCLPPSFFLLALFSFYHVPSLMQDYFMLDQKQLVPVSEL